MKKNPYLPKNTLNLKILPNSFKNVSNKSKFSLNTIQKRLKKLLKQTQFKNVQIKVKANTIQKCKFHFRLKLCHS